MEKLSVKEALGLVNSVYEDFDYRIRVLLKKKEDIPPAVFRAEMEELCRARMRTGMLREAFIGKVLNDALPPPAEMTNTNTLESLETKLDNLWNLLTADKKDEAVDAALAAGEYIERLTIPEEAPYMLALRYSRLDYVRVAFVDDVYVCPTFDKGLMYTIDYVVGSITFDERLAGQTVVVRYKLA